MDLVSHASKAELSRAHRLHEFCPSSWSLGGDHSLGPPALAVLQACELEGAGDGLGAGAPLQVCSFAAQTDL